MPANGNSNTPEAAEMAAGGQNGSGADRYAPTTWGSRYQDLTVPSGQTCKVRKVGVEQLIADGVIDDLDLLTKFVQEKHIEPKAKSVKKGGKAAKSGRSGNPAVAAQQDAVAAQARAVLGGASGEEIRSMFRMMDAVVMAAVVAPKLHPSVPMEEREDDKVYIDDVDAQDKSFLVNFVFSGVNDLERFREQFNANAASLGDVEDVEVPPK